MRACSTPVPTPTMLPNELQASVMGIKDAVVATGTQHLGVVQKLPKFYNDRRTWFLNPQWPLG